MSVEPPPVAKERVQFREVEPGKVVVVGIDLGVGDLFSLFFKAWFAALFVLIATLPLWIIPFAMYQVEIGR